MNFLRRFPIASIRTRLAALMMVIVALIAVYIDVEFPIRLRVISLAALSEKAQSIADMTAYSVSAALVFDDRTGAVDALTAARQNKDLAFVAVVDSAGKEYVSFFAADGYRRLCARPWESVSSVEGDSVFVVSSDIIHSQGKIGEVHLGLTLNYLNERIERSRGTIVLMSVLVFIGGALAAFSISTIVTRRISRMVQTVEQIAAGDLSQRAPAESSDEIGRLAGSFNIMVNNLEAAQRNLETNVEERTRALRREIVEHNKTEESLRRIEELFRLITENAADLIAVVNTAGELQYFSPSIERLRGSDLLGTHVFREIVPEDKELAMNILRGAVESGKGYRHTFRLQVKDGSIRHIQSQGSPIHDANGKVSGMVLVSRDVTEQKIMEEQVRQAQKLESIGTLAGGVAHDFNNILAIILSYASLLEDQRTDPAQFSEGVKVITNTVDRAAAIVRQLLTFARKTEVSFRPVQINEIVAEVAAMLRQTLPRTISISTNPEADLPPITGDSNQLHQVLLNFCINARDAMPDGGMISMTTAKASPAEVRGRFPSASTAGYVHITVQDTGSGMEPEVLEHIFEPFFTTKTGGKGTGLGLAVVYGVINNHRGFVHVESVPGSGTTFHVFLPSDSNLPADGPATIDAGIVQGENEGLILFIEDEEALRASASAFLKKRGHAIVLAEDGLEAVRLFEQLHERIALVVSDIGLPGLGGWAAYQKMREIDPKLKILFASGFLEPSLASHISATPGCFYIQKPYRLNELASKIAEIIVR